MKTVELYRKVRKACHRDGMSGRDAAKYFGVNRRTISKILEHSEPPGYRRSKPIRRPKLDGFTGIIDTILKADADQPKKQRHTAKRIFERLCDEHGFRGGLTIVRDYVREHKRLHKEVFVPLEHAPGHAQADFGEALAIIGGVQQKVHYMAFDLPHSDASFVKAYPAETMEAFCDGHVSAFAFFGGIPLSILYDNTKIAVSKIRKNGKRDLTEAFTRLQSHYLFDAKFGRPAKGNDKGHVEGMVGFIRRNYLVPIPRFDSFDALNKHLEEQCLKRQGTLLRGETETIERRFGRDLDALIKLPAAPFDVSRKESARVNSSSMVRFHNNDYSVPVAYAHHQVLVRGYVHEVVISVGSEVVAQHKRSYEKADLVFDPMHYLPLLEQKVGALDQAAPLKGWDLPDEFNTLHRLLEARMSKKGKREYVQVLRLMETFELDEVHGALKQALDMGAIGYDAVKHLLLCRIEKRPPKLDLDCYPYLPKTHVETTKATNYACLLGNREAA
jgi:transposase